MFRMGMPKRNGSFLLFSVFAALDEFEHFFPLNAPAVPDAKRRDLAFVQKPQPLCRGLPAKSSDTHAASAHRDICPGSCVSAFLCGLLHCSAQKRPICYSDASSPRSTWTAAATAATILMPNSSVFLITFIGSPPLLSTHTAVHRSSRERVLGRTAFLRFLPRNSRNRAAPAPHLRLRRTPSPR